MFIRRALATTLLPLAAVTALAAPVHAGGVPLSATLTGAAEAPGPGDPDGSGSAVLTVNPGLGEICYTLTATGIAATTGAHIHRAPVGVAGPIVVHLVAPEDGTSSGCTEVDRALAQEIIRSPEDFYVNVHSVEFRPGAIRGQLSRP